MRMRPESCLRPPVRESTLSRWRPVYSETSGPRNAIARSRRAAAGPSGLVISGSRSSTTSGNCTSHKIAIMMFV